jgi:magnesium chelatase family protein
MIASIPSATLLGIRGHPVLVEAHVSNGLPGFAVIGLPDADCREARELVRAALLFSGLPWLLRQP